MCVLVRTCFACKHKALYVRTKEKLLEMIEMPQKTTYLSDLNLDKSAPRLRSTKCSRTPELPTVERFQRLKKLIIELFIDTYSHAKC